MRKPLRIAIPALVLAAAGAAAFFTLDLQAKLGLGPEDDTTLVLYGNVDIRQVELGFRVSGRIAEMPFEEGDTVHAGELLATLDRRPYEDDFRLAAAEVAIEDANVEKLEAGTRQAEIEQARALVAERQATLRKSQTKSFFGSRRVSSSATNAWLMVARSHVRRTTTPLRCWARRAPA